MRHHAVPLYLLYFPLCFRARAPLKYGVACIIISAQSQTALAGNKTWRIHPYLDFVHPLWAAGRMTNLHLHFCYKGGVTGYQHQTTTKKVKAGRPYVVNYPKCLVICSVLSKTGGILIIIARGCNSPGEKQKRRRPKLQDGKKAGFRSPKSFGGTPAPEPPLPLRYGTLRGRTRDVSTGETLGATNMLKSDQSDQSGS